jgi:hypothetical protein
MNRHATLSFLFAFCLVLASCSRSKITGEWKMTECRLVDARNDRNVFQIDLNDLQKTRKELLLGASQGLVSDDPADSLGNIDPIVDELLEDAKTAGFELRDNGEFLMVSKGLIVPTAVPGWHFGDSIAGT